MPNFSLNFFIALLLPAAYLAVLLASSLINGRLYAPRFARLAPWLNLFTIAAFTAGFFAALNALGFALPRFYKPSLFQIALSLFAAAMMYALTDRVIEPFVAKRFKTGFEQYKKGVAELKKTPIPSFLLVCIIAPIGEELLFRAIVLGGLYNGYGAALALLVSASLFALTHLNPVQGVSALVCGLALGLVYIKTRSIISCIILHCAYNALAYFMSGSKSAQPVS